MDQKTRDLVMRSKLGMMLLQNSNLIVDPKKHPKSPFGWTIDPKVKFHTGNKKSVMRKYEETLNFFRIRFSIIHKQKQIVVSGYKELACLSSEISQLQDVNPTFFGHEFMKEWTVFSEILEMYANEGHYTKKGFLKILEMRIAFMPRALSKERFIERHFGEA